MDDALIDELCRLHGVAREYTDIWGRSHAVAVDSRLRLLEALGVDTSSEAALREALAAAANARFARVLEPVEVVRENAGAAEIEIALPVAELDADWRWRLVEEGGAERTGMLAEFRPAPIERREVDGELRELRALRLEGLPEPGYHCFEISGPSGTFAAMLIVVPETCYRPAAVSEGGRVWGLAVQLFSVRSQRNWGVGDFTDLGRLLELAAREGAALVGLNPLHALFPHAPERASPYGPSNRLFLNVLYIDVELVPDFGECEAARERVQSAEFQAQLRALRSSELVDYSQVGALKLEILELLYASFRSRHLETGSARATAFREFEAKHGEQLRSHALYEALQAHLQSADSEIWGWPVWPEAYRAPEADAVAEFSAAQLERIEFFEYLQWQAELQLDAAGRRAYELGLGVGIYEDLAVGVDVGGSEVWANQSLYAAGARIGVPPDDFNLTGQDWGLPPWRPDRLRESAYAPFVSTLRRSMRAAGALRIDHVMALMRQFWIPPGGSPADGTYVSYPFEELLGIVALESRRNRCLVVGEDLGTVPDEVRDALEAVGVLSYRLLYFEKRDDGAYRGPDEYAPEALVAVGTHDLPTLAGFWSGNDLEWRRRLELFPSEDDYERSAVQRAEDRVRLLLALAHEGLLPEGADVNVMSTHEITAELVSAVHEFLARTPSRVMLVQPEDVLGLVEQTNLPGTTDGHPNWRRKLGLDLEAWLDEPRFAGVFGALRDERGSAVAPPSLPVPERRVPAVADIPRATYRLQFHAGFTLDDAVAVVPYLAALGVSHCYASPLIKARPGSPHGYDIVDHGTINPELGGREALERFCAALEAHGLGLILDIVPNHMGVMGRDNPWWLEVLENGPASRYADYFDIDWNPLKEELRGKVLLPLLDDHYGNVLERGGLELRFDPATGEFSVEFYEHRLPLDPREYPRIFEHRGTQLADRLGAEDGRALEFASLMTALGNLPPRDDRREGAAAERARDKEILKGRLAELYAAEADIAAFIDETLREYNGTDDYAADATLFHALLERQAWRLAFWRVASDQINYRRFFDVNELAALRMEQPAVFDATHRLVFELIGAGSVQGLRVDHPDGLFDPAGYFEELQQSVLALAKMSGTAITASEETCPLYVVAEKILARDETLPPDWRVYGTTGYDFARTCGALFVEPESESAFEALYRDLTGERASFEEIERAAKELIMDEALASELTVLETELARIAELDIHTRDFTGRALRKTLAAITASFPVYRTYVTADGASESDVARLDEAVSSARQRSVATDTNIFDFVRDTLLLGGSGRDDAHRDRVARFAMQFQQLTSPVAAKGSEDTAFYRYSRLASLNEVGGDPAAFGVDVAAFHEANAYRLEHWPHSMLATSTHDSKRSEDVRLRIHALSELPQQWRASVEHWMEINAAHKQRLETMPAPSPNDEYLYYQTLVGIWPRDLPAREAAAAVRERIGAYMLKAAREAKLRTSWVNPAPDYEQALEDFVASTLDVDTDPSFAEEVAALVATLADAGRVNSLAQTLFKLTAPGVPDIYQGTELWDTSLVDPDNRRPVDFAGRAVMLEELERASADPEALAETLERIRTTLSDGRIKLYLIRQVLALRRRWPELFERGDYVALETQGARARSLCAYARRLGDSAVIACGPRLAAGLLGTGENGPFSADVWGETAIALPATLAGREFTNVLTGQRIRAAGRGGVIEIGPLLEAFPVALLAAEPIS